MPRAASRSINWYRKVDLPLRRTPMQTVALPGIVSTRRRRGTPVAGAAS